MALEMSVLSSADTGWVCSSYALVIHLETLQLKQDKEHSCAGSSVVERCRIRAMMCERMLHVCSVCVTLCKHTLAAKATQWQVTGNLCS